MMGLQLPEEEELNLELPEGFTIRPELMGMMGGLSIEGGTTTFEKESSFNLSQTGTFQKEDFMINKDGIMRGAPDNHHLPTAMHGVRISLNDLEDKQQLGQGASGIVRLALHKPTNQLMAVKTINVLEKAKRDQMVKELKIMCGNQCGGLVAMYDAFYEEGSMHIVMEYMDGGSLSDLVKHYKGTGLKYEGSLANAAKQMLAGLNYLHKVRHQIHRDLKPANVMCTTQGDVKITDFGISLELESTMGMASTFVGTASYMSPERLAGNSYSFSSDVWSLGLIMVELATGIYPYPPTGNYFQLLNQIIEGDPPRLGEDHSTDFQDFVEKCLQEDPKQRADSTELLGHPWITSCAKSDNSLAPVIVEVKEAAAKEADDS